MANKRTKTKTKTRTKTRMLHQHPIRQEGKVGTIRKKGIDRPNMA